MNIVVGGVGYGSAVLIRALEPVVGSEHMERLRGKVGVEATNGPAKVCQALGIDRSFNGHDLGSEPLRLLCAEPVPSSQTQQTTRIGISKEKAKPWRWYIRGNPYVSRR